MLQAQASTRLEGPISSAYHALMITAQRFPSRNPHLFHTSSATTNHSHRTTAHERGPQRELKLLDNHVCRRKLRPRGLQCIRSAVFCGRTRLLAEVPVQRTASLTDRNIAYGSYLERYACTGISSAAHCYFLRSREPAHTTSGPRILLDSFAARRQRLDVIWGNRWVGATYGHIDG
jgi:hypothetical protein